MAIVETIILNNIPLERLLVGTKVVHYSGVCGKITAISPSGLVFFLWKARTKRGEILRVVRIRAACYDIFVKSKCKKLKVFREHVYVPDYNKELLENL